MSTPTTPELLTTQEAAVILRRHPSTITRYVERGELAAVKAPGAPLLIPRSSIDEYLARYMVAANPPPPPAPRAPRPIPDDRQRLRDEFPHLVRDARRSA